LGLNPDGVFVKLWIQAGMCEGLQSEAHPESCEPTTALQAVVGSVDLPHTHPEEIADPKAFLHGALRVASELKGRRLRDFNVSQAAHRVAEYVDDFSPLKSLPAFAKLEERLAEVVRRLSGVNR